MRTLAIGAVLALSLAAAGCGGGSKTMSAAEYAAKLNTICSDASADRKQAGNINSPADLVTQGPKLLAAFDRLLARAEKLKPPSRLKADADKLLSEAKQLRDLLAQVIAAAKANDLSKLNQLGAKADVLTSDFHQVGRGLGARACGHI